MKKIHFLQRHSQIDDPDGLAWGFKAFWWRDRFWGGKYEKRFLDYVGESYYSNFNWKVSFNCPLPPFRIGLKDGGKVVCDHLKLKEECLVYSIGSRGVYRFEVITNKHIP